MLKIKDEVDLKELEKFGFRFVKTTTEEILYKPKKGEKEVIEIKVNIKTRELDFSGFSDLFYTKEDTLYDLIQAGLVEKC